MTDARLKRMEDKLDTLSEAIVQMARMEERMISLFKRLDRVDDTFNKLDQRMDTLELENVVIWHGDGLLGWPEFAPFDGIILAACPEAVPQSLFDQLADGGRLIAPVGLGQTQQLILYRRDGDSIEETPLDTAFFVPALAGLQ